MKFRGLGKCNASAWNYKQTYLTICIYLSPRRKNCNQVNPGTMNQNRQTKKMETLVWHACHPVVSDNQSNLLNYLSNALTK